MTSICHWCFGLNLLLWWQVPMPGGVYVHSTLLLYWMVQAMTSLPTTPVPNITPNHRPHILLYGIIHVFLPERGANEGVSRTSGWSRSKVSYGEKAMVGERGRGWERGGPRLTLTKCTCPHVYKSGLTLWKPRAQLCARGEIRFFTEWKFSNPAYIRDLFTGIYIIRYVLPWF